MKTNLIFIEIESIKILYYKKDTLYVGLNGMPDLYEYPMTYEAAKEIMKQASKGYHSGNRFVSVEFEEE